MVAVSQWRKFNFFEVQQNVDNGNLAQNIKDDTITCCSSGRGVLYIGNSKGWVYLLNRQMQVTSFPAHTSPVKLIYSLDQTSLLVTVGNSSECEIKLWSPERLDPQGLPSCLRTLRPDPRMQTVLKGSAQGSAPCPTVTAVTVHPNLKFMAVGFSDGSIMTYRGEIRRERASKCRLLVTLSSGSVTNLHLRHTNKTTHLFVTTQSKVYCIDCTIKDKETTIELDSHGCEPGCATLADTKHEYEFLMARPDAIYGYTCDSKAACYVFEGEKQSLFWFKGHLIVAAKDQMQPQSNSGTTTLTVYDPINKLVALTTTVTDFVTVCGEWGGLYVMTSQPVLLHLVEKDLQSKLDLLFKKNQFDIAISLAKMQCCDEEEVCEILRQYGDWLYAKGNPSAAMTQYIKTIPYLEPSFVIKKFLDTCHLDNLTTYLQELHRSGVATSDHTTLMLNCYTRLNQTNQLDEFISNLNGSRECDVALGVKVCRRGGHYDQALKLALSNNLHNLYIQILIQDKKEYQQALNYISSLDFSSAHSSVLEFGSILLNHIPDSTVELLVKLSTDYVPANQQPNKNGPVFAPPEDFEFLLVGCSETSIAFLEGVSNLKTLSSHLNTTLLAELLHQHSMAPEGQDRTCLSEKIVRLLRNSEVPCHRDHALLLCDKHQFAAGKLILWEQAGMYEEVMQWHADNSDIESALKVCERHAAQNTQLWVIALRLICKQSPTQQPNSTFLNTVLKRIEEGDLLPPLQVLGELCSSPHITLGEVRPFLLGVAHRHEAAIEAEEVLLKECLKQTKEIKENICDITTKATEFTGTKCNICNNNLELPSLHFLCRHSFHVHCFDSYSESDECPVCLPNNKVLREAIQTHDSNSSRAEILQEQLDKNQDSFAVLSNFIAKGVFTNFENLGVSHSSLNVTKLPEVESRLNALELGATRSTGAVGEARLRLREHHGQGVLEATPEARLRQLGPQRDPQREASPLPSEGHLRALVKTSSIQVSPEARRLKVGDQHSRGEIEVGRGWRGAGGSSVPGILAHITPSPNPSPASSFQKSFSDSISNAIIKKREDGSSNTTGGDNPFSGDISFGDEDEDAEDYDDAKKSF